MRRPFTNDKITASLRLSGEVRRYHTLPMMRDQTNAEHSWQVWRIYYEVFGLPPENVSAFIILHDVEEIGGIDAPGRLKREYPELKELSDRIARRSLQHLGVSLPQITVVDRARIKACDLIEVYEFAIDEINRGNQYAQAAALEARHQIELICSQFESTDMPDDSRRVRAWVSRIE